MQPDPSKNYYEILGVPPTADRGQIESAYRSLARQHHPDARPEGAGSDAEFKRVTEAYETLGDTERRRQYDRQRARPSRSARAFAFGESTHAAPPPAASPGDFLDLFNRWFSSGPIAPPGFGPLGPTPPQSQPPGRAGGRRDVEVELPLSPEEALRGGPCEFTVSVAEMCPRCRAAGAACCEVCRGTGQVMHRFRLQIHLPPGLASGEILCVPGKGKPARGGEPAGDLRLKIRVRPCWP